MSLIYIASQNFIRNNSILVMNLFAIVGFSAILLLLLVPHTCARLGGNIVWKDFNSPFEISAWCLFLGLGTL